jgi:potassium efflux system protein
LSAIWSSVMPALGIFHQVTLWEKMVGTPGDEVLIPVTLADLGTALLVVFVTYISSRSVPRLLELILRQRTQTDPGSRIAYSTLARYFIVLLGVSITASEAGFSWGNIQWLVAALGVGIGFGLQEIVANFISGLIILVERPIRVGDIVTVGDVSGVVTQLRLRATTITNWDRQELLVPNKEFVTNHVLNWSLSDEVIRAVLRVGVAYGSDLRKALRIIREAVEADERVLTDPNPQVTFDEFGENSLNITARAFHATPSNRREIISDLNLAINERLTEAGIVVAFPQRDVHLDTSSPLEIRLQREDDEQEG